MSSSGPGSTPSRALPWGVLVVGLLGVGATAGLFKLAGGDFKSMWATIEELQVGAPESKTAVVGADLPTPLREIAGRCDQYWKSIEAPTGPGYQSPRIVAFIDRVESECHDEQLCTGPFYCLATETIYFDVGFTDELVLRHPEAGPLARVYILGHLFAHHLQARLGTTDRIRDQLVDPEVSPSERRRLRLKSELQADYFAGVWANHSSDFQSLLETATIDAAMRAVEAVVQEREKLGRDGRLLLPDAFSHGRIDQRVQWFLRGFESGDLQEHDPFRTDEL